jgi:membrane protein DedA with SNARE-associated domain
MNRALRIFALAGAVMSGIGLLLVGLMLRNHMEFIIAEKQFYDTKRLFLGLLVAMIVSLYLARKLRAISK